MSRFSSRSRRATTALPGYDNLGYEDFGHPASGPQPELDEYGIDSDFGEGVHEGPYRSGPPPASYGWEPDHPAVSDTLVEDFGLRQAMERKAAKCIRIAEAQLGRRASQNDIEELALRFMDLPNNQINNKLASMSMGESHESDWHMAEDMDEIIDDLDIMGEDLESSFMAEDMTANRWANRRNTNKPWQRHNSMAKGASTDRLAELLAEQVESLKMANARLASQVRKLADDAVAKGTGLSEGEEELMEESVEKQASWAPRQQSRGIGRLASVLSEILSEDETAEEESAEESVLASILAEVEDKKASFYRGATEEEAEVEAEEEAGEDTMGLDATKEASIDPKLARIFEASEEEAEEEEAEDSDEIQMSAEEEPVSKKAHARPRIATRQPAVKTLGNISREASSASDDLSKLWDTAPDVSKYFN